MKLSTPRRTLTAFAIGMIVTAAPQLHAQWSTTYEQFYLPGSFNWQFRSNYPAADRLFNAFDYGHAILYEKLWTKPGAPTSLLEEREYNFITRELLVSPPGLPLEEAAIEIAYARLAPEAKTMFDWAHLLHRQIYDVWADERMPVPAKDAKVQELLRYYKTRKDVAFSSVPKTMELMEGQPYSLAFRKNYPKFNGLIWAYHWLQIGLYEPLLAGKDSDERQTGILAAVARFKQMIENPPTWMPRVMPMSPAVAPLFTARYPEAAIIFDNLHSMHDVVSDILANPAVPRNQKRARILEAARRYRDNTSYVMTVAQWKEMAAMMGVQNMGGPVSGFLAAFPTPTLERGAVMARMDHSASAGMPGMQHGAAPPPRAPTAGMDHSKMPGMVKPDTAAKSGTTPPMAGMDHSMPDVAADSNSAPSDEMMALHMKLLADPVIRARMMQDPEMRRMMTSMIDAMPADHRQMMQQMISESSAENARSSTPAKAGPARKTAAKVAVKKPVAKKPVAKAATKPAAKKPVAKKPPPKKDPMAGMDHSKHKM